MNTDTKTKNLKLVKLHMNEYMDDWQKFNETSLSEEEEFYHQKGFVKILQQSN